MSIEFYNIYNILITKNTVVICQMLSNNYLIIKTGASHTACTGFIYSVILHLRLKSAEVLIQHIDSLLQQFIADTAE